MLVAAAGQVDGLFNKGVSHCLSAHASWVIAFTAYMQAVSMSVAAIAAQRFACARIDVREYC